MKLFTKTIFFFIGIILLEAFLSIVLITNIIKKNNLETGKNELGKEAAIIYENYNSWKRNIWKKLIAVKTNPTILRDVTYYTPFSKWFLLRDLQTMYIRSGIDLIVVHYKKTNSYEMLPLTLNTFSMHDVSHLVPKRTHPYIEVTQLAHALAMIGTVTMQEKGDVQVDIFLIKRIDENFCSQLSLNQRSFSAFFIDNKYLLGAPGKKFRNSTINLPHIRLPYTAFYNIEIDKKYYNIVLQKLGLFARAHESHPHDLYLATFLSNELYIRRLALIKKITIYVTLGITLLTIFISFFFSRNITNPIKTLVDAMYQLKQGAYKTIRIVEGKNEIARLCTGFNEMAKTLRENKIIMNNYINEITTLNDYNEKIIHSLHTGIIIINNSLIIEKVNRFFLNSFGLNENALIGKEVLSLPIDIFDKDMQRDIKRILTGKKREISRIKRSEHERVFELKLYPLYEHSIKQPIVSDCVLVIENISKKIEFEEKIFQAEKLSSLSMLSAGVAHEINNPLSSIMTNVQNLIEDEKHGNKKEALGRIEQETRRIAKIIRQLLTFSSSNTHSSTESDSNQIIQDVIGLITYAVKKQKKVTITFSPSYNLPRAQIKEDEFKQVLINLITNSIQAIEKKGTITIQSGFNTKKGKLFITIEDNGIGIPKEIIPKIFDPFFTTKQNGEGTGLGLSVVYGLLKKYNGEISIHSKPATGTKVTLLLYPVLS